MTITIHWGSGSPFSWRALLALELKQLPYNSARLDLSRGDHKAPEFRALSPRGKFPVLEHDGFVLLDSLAIIAYLDRLQAEPPLLGREAQETGRIFEFIGWWSDQVNPELSAVIQPIFREKTEGNEEAIIEAAKRAAPQLETFNGGLGKRRNINAADIVAFPDVMRLRRALDKTELGLALRPFNELYPAIASWVAQFEALPGYARTYPPHWSNP